MRVQAQQGYALLAFVVFVLGVGGGFLSFMPTASVATFTRAQFATKDQHAVVAARQSLLSYAALYPYLYGPTGSGPGHLPCPDTDAQGNLGSGQASIVGVRRDGPNPPCANPVLSTGKLPRHTVLPGNRYLFHTEPYQRFDYVVSGEFVNNPLNRLLNLSDLNQLGSKPVSLLNVSSLDGTRTKTRVTISSQALAVAVAPAVALWLTQRINAQIASHCGQSIVSNGVAVLLSSVIQDEAVSCRDLLVEPVENCSVDSILAPLLDQPLVQGDSCLIDALAENTLEDVPANRHWFLRNYWHLSVSVERTEDCSQPIMLLVPCRLERVIPSTPFLGRENRNAVNAQQISLNFRWVQTL